jgi:hypothetical protein
MKPTLERHAIDVDQCDRKTVSLIALEKGRGFRLSSKMTTPRSLSLWRRRVAHAVSPCDRTDVPLSVGE